MSKPCLIFPLTDVFLSLKSLHLHLPLSDLILISLITLLFPPSRAISAFSQWTYCFIHNCHMLQRYHRFVRSAWGKSRWWCWDAFRSRLADTSHLYGSNFLSLHVAHQTVPKARTVVKSRYVIRCWPVESLGSTVKWRSVVTLSWE